MPCVLPEHFGRPAGTDQCTAKWGLPHPDSVTVHWGVAAGSNCQAVQAIAAGLEGGSQWVRLGDGGRVGIQPPRGVTVGGGSNSKIFKLPLIRWDLEQPSSKRVPRSTTKICSTMELKKRTYFSTTSRHVSNSLCCLCPFVCNYSEGSCIQKGTGNKRVLDTHRKVVEKYVLFFGSMVEYIFPKHTCVHVCQWRLSSLLEYV